MKLAVKHCYQTGQFKSYKNWLKKPKSKCDILSNFQTMSPFGHFCIIPIDIPDIVFLAVGFAVSNKAGTIFVKEHLTFTAFQTGCMPF